MTLEQLAAVFHKCVVTSEVPASEYQAGWMRAQGEFLQALARLYCIDPEQLVAAVLARARKERKEGCADCGHPRDLLHGPRRCHGTFRPPKPQKG